MSETLTTNLKTAADTADKEFIGADTDNAEYLRNITDLTNAELKELEKNHLFFTCTYGGPTFD